MLNRNGNKNLWKETSVILVRGRVSLSKYSWFFIERKSLVSLVSLQKNMRGGIGRWGQESTKDSKKNKEM